MFVLRADCKRPEPAVPSARVVGLGSKLYPSNMQRMLNKDLTQFMPSLSRERQNRAQNSETPNSGGGGGRVSGMYNGQCKSSAFVYSHRD